MGDIQDSLCDSPCCSCHVRVKQNGSPYQLYWSGRWAGQNDSNSGDLRSAYMLIHRKGLRKLWKWHENGIDVSRYAASLSVSSRTGTDFNDMWWLAITKSDYYSRLGYWVFSEIFGSRIESAACDAVQGWCDCLSWEAAVPGQQLA